MFKRLFPLAATAALVLPATSIAASPPKKPAPKPQPCQIGTVRALAYVKGTVADGIANLPNQWSGAENLFGFRWSCSGGTVEVRKSPNENGGFDVRFPGNPGQFAIANALTASTYAVSVSKNPDGSFHVQEAGNAPGASFPFRNDAEFVIIVF